MCNANMCAMMVLSAFTLIYSNGLFYLNYEFESFYAIQVAVNKKFDRWKLALVHVFIEMHGA